MWEKEKKENEKRMKMKKEARMKNLRLTQRIPTGTKETL